MTTATVRRFGNSLGIVIPKMEAVKMNLHEGDTVDVELHKAAGLASIVGLFKGQFGDIDALLDEIDEGEDD